MRIGVVIPVEGSGGRRLKVSFLGVARRYL